jgi:GntR family carbon starvation induced transcriptional regulator
LESTHQSLTSAFADALRIQIVAGHKPPESRLQLQELSQEFSVSLSPVREGLARLASEGYVVPVGQRGYRVAPVSLAELTSVVDLRIDLELKGLRDSIRKGDEDWEMRVMTSFQKLKRFEAQRWLPQEIQAWETRHEDFHHTLIAACGSDILMRFCRTLHNIADRYRRVFYESGHERDRNISFEHAEIYAATMERDAERACAALRTHIQRTSDNVLRAMRSRDGTHQVAK